MKLTKEQIDSHNNHGISAHDSEFQFLSKILSKKGLNVENIIEQIQSFQVAIPSWALGTGGTRFGRFTIGGEPRDLEEKISDVGLINDLTKAAGSISLHIPWDIPEDPGAILELASSYGIVFDAVNSNTFQDEANQKLSYKFGSLCHTDDAVRAQAIEHNRQVIDVGQALGSKSLTVWLADGSSFPGQLNFQKALERTLDSLKAIYKYLPADWKLYIEYKPYEPNFYSTVIQDCGTSHLLATECGNRAFSLVDLGHHLPNTNIEQIVATLMWRGKLGGFHFNDSKFGDDDLTVGSIKPYQLFLIFNELVYGMTVDTNKNPSLAWMIDASHNVKDPLEDLMQSLEAIRLAYAQALIVNQNDLEELRSINDVTLAQEILQEAFRTDVRPLLKEARKRSGGALNPIDIYRKLGIRNTLRELRGLDTVATGL
ncbi:MAG: sugar isomerase [Saprospiraceae bacterium]|nr:sugar isomerase [Saprospiraceae bacterium]